MQDSIKKEWSLVDTSSKVEETKLFFGHKSKIIRIDQVSHPIFKTLSEMSEANTWFPKVVDMKTDKTRFDELPEDAKRAFKCNIAYQTIMDSGAVSGISDVLLSVTTSNILEILYRRIMIEETIHSQSYSHGLLEVFGQEATPILNLIYDDPFIQKRMDEENKLFSSMHKLIENEEKVSEDEKKEALIRTLFALYALESIKFPFSFLITFLINDRFDNPIPGFNKIIQLIAHDELTVHVPTTKAVVGIMRSEKYQGFTHFFESQANGKSKAYEILEEYIIKIVKQEYDWAKYLLDGRKDMSDVINVESAKHFIDWRAKTTFNLLGFSNNPYSKVETSPLTVFFENYRSINKQNAALQEIDNISYQKAQLKDDWDQLNTEVTVR